MTTNNTEVFEVLIYTERESFPGGRAYLCADGSLSSERSQASAHWNIQFDTVVAENWIVRPGLMERTGN